MRPLRIDTIKRLEHNHNNDMDMDIIVEEPYEEFGLDRKQGAISILKDPVNPSENGIKDIIDKNGLSSSVPKHRKEIKKESHAGLLHDRIKCKSSYPHMFK